MDIVDVRLGIRSYQIKIERGLLSKAGLYIRKVISGSKAVVITDDIVDRIYADIVVKSLAAADFSVKKIVIPHGEDNKTLKVLGDVYYQLSTMDFHRSDVIITLGGGLVGDLGGLAAATFLRGVALVQIPTTLLGQTDSSIGGKVAVDLPAGKNLVGAFYQPKLVLADPDVLRKLPVNLLHDGLAEIIKYGCISNEELFTKLESYRDENELLADAEWIIRISCGIKARIVEQDEGDNSIRMMLNFGHTLGHAVERCENYCGHSHGQAVSIGMVAITAATEKMGLTEQGTKDRILHLLTKYCLPVKTDISSERLFEAMGNDKKHRGEYFTLAVLRSIGQGRLIKVRKDKLGEYFLL